MSLSFEDAEMCQGPRCTNLLTSRSEYKNGFCDLCFFELQEHCEKMKEEKKLDEEREEYERRRSQRI